MELSSIFPSKYLKAADLKGREPTVVIAKADMEKIGDDNKLVLYFQGKEKGIVCNRTNADRIAYMYGQNTDDWMGKEIVLYTEMVNFQGKVTEAIRIKPPVKRDPGYQVTSGSPNGSVTSPKPVKPQAPVENDFHDDSVPF